MKRAIMYYMIKADRAFTVKKQTVTVLAIGGYFILWALKGVFEKAGGL